LVAEALQGAKAMDLAPLLSERELVDLALHFASASAWHEITRWAPFLVSGRPSVVAVFSDRTRYPSDSPPEDFDATHGDAHRRFRGDLEAIAAGKVDQRLVKRIEQTASRVVLVPSFALSRDALEVKHQHLPEDLEAALAYVTALLLDSSRPFRDALCRCRLDICGKFFLSESAETGRARRVYCSQEHMREAHERGAVLRMRKFRERKRAAKSARKPK